MARRPEWVKPVETAAGRRYEVRVHGTRPDGTRFQHKKRFRTVDEAVKWRSTVTSELAHGTHAAPSEMTLQQAADAWMAGQRIRPKTRSAYITALRPMIDALGDKPVQKITKADIEAVVQALLNGTSAMGTWHAPTKLPKAAKKTRAPWSPASINPMLARARSIFADLMAQGVVARNPAALVKALPGQKPVLTTLSADDMAALLESTRDDPFHVAWLLASYGLRRGEILALRWDAVDFDAETVTIDASRVATAGKATTGVPKTPSSVRTLPMPPDLTAALRRERTRQNEVQLQLGEMWPGSELVVVDALGQPPYPDTVTKAWGKALAAAGLPHVRLHDARHSCATLMHMRGVPAVVIAAWLGHTDARFTLATYAHSTNEALAAAAATFTGTATDRPRSNGGA